MLPGPFGPGSCFSVCTHGTCLTQGSEALLSDLEDMGGRGIGCLSICIA